MSGLWQLLLGMLQGAATPTQTQRTPAKGFTRRPKHTPSEPKAPPSIQAQTLGNALPEDAQPLATPGAGQGSHLPLEPWEPVPPQAHYTHPRATHRIQLGATTVDYAFKRSKRRTIGMSIGPDGLAVNAPTWVNPEAVHAAMRDKAQWIVRKLMESHQRQQQLGAARIVWADGVVLPYLGERLQVVLDSAHMLKKNSVRFEAAQPLPAGDVLPLESSAVTARGAVTTAALATWPWTHTLRLGLPADAQPQQIRDAVQAWLMRQAKAMFIERLNHYAPQLGVQWQRLSLSSATTRWGSASTNGAIRLNWRLIQHKLAVIDYVVVHELSHLREMNHSARFWQIVQSVMPDHEQRRQVLKDEPLPPWT